jgi:phage gpG-like protein
MANEIFNLMGFGALLERMSVVVEEEIAEGVKRGADKLKEAAKARIGFYPADGSWPQLADSTQEDRGKHGFAPNDPLLRTGELRESIGALVVGKHAVVGSDLDIALYQELGTEKIPPRPFLGSSAAAEAEAIAKDIGIGVMRKMTGKE